MTDAPTIHFLTDGGQAATSILDRLVAYLDRATRSLDVAIYDAHLAPDLAEKLLAAAEARGVAVRAVYNDLTKFSPEHRPNIPRTRAKRRRRPAYHSSNG